MATRPPENDAFLREVEEEYRRDQIGRFWKRWGWWVIIGIVGVLAAYGGFLYWRHTQAEKVGKLGDELALVTDALQGKQDDKAIAAAKPILDSGNPRYRALARFAVADALIQKNDLKGAAAAFKAVADDGAVPQPHRDLALIRQTSVEYDSLPPQEVVSRLKGLAVQGNPWFATAGEMVAIAYIRMNQPQQAAPLLTAIARDKTVPPTIRSRIGQLAGSIGVDVVEQPAGEAK